MHAISDENNINTDVMHGVTDVMLGITYVNI